MAHILRFSLACIAIVGFLSGISKKPLQSQVVHAQDDTKWEKGFSFVSYDHDTGAETNSIIVFREDGTYYFIDLHMEPNFTGDSLSITISPSRKYYVAHSAFASYFEEVGHPETRLSLTDPSPSYYFHPEFGFDAVFDSAETILITRGRYDSVQSGELVDVIFWRDVETGGVLSFVELPSDLELNGLQWDDILGLLARPYKWWSFSELGQRGGLALRWNTNLKSFEVSNQFFSSEYPWLGTPIIIHRDDYSRYTGEFATVESNTEYPMITWENQPELLPNVIRLYTNGADYRTSKEISGSTIYFSDPSDGTDIIHQIYWIKNGDGLLVATSDSWILLTRDGTQQPLDIPYDEFTFLTSTPHGWIMSSSAISNTEFLYYELNDENQVIPPAKSEIPQQFNGVKFVFEEIGTQANITPFTPISPYNWGSSACLDTIESHLRPYWFADTLSPQEVFAEPSTSALVIDAFSAKSVIIMVSGPECHDNDTWWRAYVNGRTIGWVREFINDKRFLEQRGRDFFNEQEQRIQNQFGSLSANEAVFPNHSLSCSGFTTKTNLRIGSAIIVMQGFPNNLRVNPSSNSDLVVQIPPGVPFGILDGPKCADGYLWWNVAYGDFQGWTPEFDNQDYFMRIAGTEGHVSIICPGFLPSRLGLDTQAQVLPGDPNNIRSEPSTNADLVGEIPGGAIFDVVGVPVCAGKTIWWQIEYDGVQGWTTEGMGDEYWVGPPDLVPDFLPTVIPTQESTLINELPNQCSGFLPSRLTIGAPARVTPGDSNNVRSQPASTSDLVGQIPGVPSLMFWKALFVPKIQRGGGFAIKQLKAGQLKVWVVLIGWNLKGENTWQI